MGFPIRRFPDQSLFAAPRDLSQRTTSFIASQRQGIHRTPLRHLIILIANARRLEPFPSTISRSPLSKPSNSTRQSTEPPSSREDGGFALDFSKRPILLQTHPGTLAVKLGLTTEMLDGPKEEAKRKLKTPATLAGAHRFAPRFAPLGSTECVSSSQCQTYTRPNRRPSASSGDAAKRTNPFLIIEGRAKAQGSRAQEQAGQKQAATAGAAGGARRDRTDDLMLAKHALSQLSYGPFWAEASGEWRVANRKRNHSPFAIPYSRFATGGPGRT